MVERKNPFRLVMHLLFENGFKIYIYFIII